MVAVTTPVRSNAVNQAIVVLDDYHPFDENTTPNKFADGNNVAQQQSQIPAYNNQSRQAYGTSPAPQISTAELQVSLTLIQIVGSDRKGLSFWQNNSDSRKNLNGELPTSNGARLN